MEWKDLISWRRWGTKRPEVVGGQENRVRALQRDINRILDDFNRSFSGKRPLSTEVESFSNLGFPKVNVEEKGTRVEVMAEVPGISEEDIHLTLSKAGDVLYLRGERKQESEITKHGTGWHRSYGLVQRSIRLPSAVKLEGAEAKLKNGILHVKLNKREESPDAKRIIVEAG